MRIIETTADLEVLVQELASAPYLALDTEFMRDSTYWPKLCLLQIASPDVAAIVDPLAPGLDLTPFFKLISDPAIVKVLHAGRQDIEIFWHKGRVIPDPLFDTQIVAMVCGFGEAASYETLARKIAHVEIDKSARFTDWARRPLTKRQLEYALADVTHLRVVYEKLSAELKRTGRESWVAEEIDALKSTELYALDPVQAWKRLKPRTANKRFLTALAAAAEWREREAQSRDVPRNRVLKDEVLLEIAANPPEDGEALERIRAVPKGFAASRQGKALMEAILAGKDRPVPELPDQGRRRHREPSPAAVDLLRTLLRLRAEEARVAPRLIANAEDIERLAAGDDEGVMALTGWRNEVFGKDAQALRSGKLSIALENGEAVVVELED
ncbi:ribonuclease D [Rhizomicrobium palustre]|uniref:Ribonuclease D n=1 Tax=Rhizomicrobium palustre TaxID=189966 RepID=A0A846N4T4_9PROT|nr:ribonuclease D [Rhizomicrobium palustre]NIK90201.1 ribonuclease D [Rhizomicrobium palustre]